MRERGLKCLILSNPCIKSAGRSREGAWIEIGHHQETNQSTKVAPVRERGLKLLLAALLRLPIVVAPVRERGLKLLMVLLPYPQIIGRSREGAWIEISNFWAKEKAGGGRSREGAWIEINRYLNFESGAKVAPVRERGLKCLMSNWEN